MTNTLYATATGCTNITGIQSSEAHSAASASVVINCLSSSLDIGDSVIINIGYDTDYDKIFTGYVKNIATNIPDGSLTITCNDVMVRAIDFFIASDDPEDPFTRENISAEDFIEDVLRLAGLTSFDFSVPTYFTLAVSQEAEVNLIGAHDYANSIANFVAWELWANRNGTIFFRNRKPYPMNYYYYDNTTRTPESYQVGFQQDTSVATITDTDILSITDMLDEVNLRNRMVVYGDTGIYASASDNESYDPRVDDKRVILPTGYYKTSVLASPLIDRQSMADKAVDYNLALYNRLTNEVQISIVGNSNLEARTVITIDSTKANISNADFYIYQLEHQWSQNGFITNMVLRR